MKIEYDPQLKTELERISREIEVEDFLSIASQKSEPTSDLAPDPTDDVEDWENWVEMAGGGYAD